MVEFIKKHKIFSLLIFTMLILFVFKKVRLETNPSYKFIKPIIYSTERNKSIISYEGYGKYPLEHGIYQYEFKINENSKEDVGNEIKVLYNLINSRLSTIPADNLIEIEIITPRFEHGCYELVAEFKNYETIYIDSKSPHEKKIYNHICYVRGIGINSGMRVSDLIKDSEINYYEYWQYFKDSEKLICPQKHSNNT